MNCKGNAKADNKFLKSYEPNKPTSCIIYLGTNNLCGHSMMQICPTDLLDWVNPKYFNLNKYSNNSPIVCFLEVHLDLHNDYPLAGKK